MIKSSISDLLIQTTQLVQSMCWRVFHLQLLNPDWPLMLPNIGWHWSTIICPTLAPTLPHYLMWAGTSWDDQQIVVVNSNCWLQWLHNAPLSWKGWNQGIIPRLESNKSLRWSNRELLSLNLLICQMIKSVVTFPSHNEQNTVRACSCDSSFYQQTKRNIQCMIQRIIPEHTTEMFVLTYCNPNVINRQAP